MINVTFPLLASAVNASYTALQAAGSVLPWTPYIPFAGPVASLTVSAGALFTASRVVRYFRNDVRDNTIDLTERARQGKLPRAHGRDVLMEQLISAAAQGFAILLGPSGSGKTALVEELAYRISARSIPSLSGWRVIRLNLRRAEGGAGLETGLKNFWYGGVENCVRSLIEVSQHHNSTSPCILFIDEIQDLLRSNPDLFDHFKEELARHDIHIIGATTDEEAVANLRSRSGTGAGMERRIQVVTVPPMTGAEAIIVLRQGAQKILSAKYPKFKIEFEEEAYLALVELSEGKFPDRILPDRALALLVEVGRYYYDKEWMKEGIFHLNEKAVVDYCAWIQRQDRKAMNLALQAKKRIPLTRQVLAERFFPQQRALTKPLRYLTEEANRFASFFRNHPNEPRICLKGPSKALLVDIAACCGPIYRCNLAQLALVTNTAELWGCLNDFLHAVSDEDGVLVLENWNPSWSLPSSVAGAPREITHKLEDSSFIQTVQRGLQQVGLAEVVKEADPAQPVVSTAAPAVIVELLHLITSAEVNTALVQSSSAAYHPSLQWESRSLEPPSFDQMVEWLEWRAQNVGINGENELRQHILTIVYTLYHLGGRESILDLAVRVLTSNESDLSYRFCAALDGHRSIDEIRQAHQMAQREIGVEPFKVIGQSSSVLRLSLNHALRGLSHSSVLWVNEPSQVRRSLLIDQMGRGVVLNHTELKTMPPALKQVVLERGLQVAGTADFVIIEEAEALQDPIIASFLTKGHYPVVCFRKSFRQPAAPQSLVAQGFNLVREQFGVAIPIPQPQERSPLFTQESEYTPPPLTKQELSSVIDSRLTNVSQELRSVLQKLYLLFDLPIDEVCQRLEADLLLYQSLDTKAICDQFHQFYGEEVGSLNRIQYAVAPHLTSKSYRALRLTALGLWWLSYPIRWGAGRIGIGLSMLSGFIFNHAFSWVQRRIISWVRRRFIGV